MSQAPLDDPIVAAELARQTRSRQAQPEPSSIIAQALASIEQPEATQEPADRIQESQATEQSQDNETSCYTAIKSISQGATTAETRSAALRISILLRDHGSLAYWMAVLKEVNQGIIGADFVISALDQRKDPSVKQPLGVIRARIEKIRKTRIDRLTNARRA
jgi:hypothetical protein